MVKVTVGEMPIDREAVGNSWFPDVYLEIDGLEGKIKLLMSGSEADAIGRSLCDHAMYSCSKPMDDQKHEETLALKIGDAE